MNIDTFRLSIIIILCIIIIVLIIIAIIIIIKRYKKQKKPKIIKKYNPYNSKIHNSTGIHSASIPISQTIENQKVIKIDFLSKKNKINAFCDCFLKPIKYSLVKIYNESCPIDLIPFNENDEISITKCFHGFHFNCIKKYLLENEKSNEFKCPICLNVLFETNIKI